MLATWLRAAGYALATALFLGAILPALLGPVLALARPSAPDGHFLIAGLEAIQMHGVLIGLITLAVGIIYYATVEAQVQ